MKKSSQLLVLGLILAMAITACKPETVKPQGTATAAPQVNKTAQAQVTPTATKMPEISTDPKNLSGVQITYLHPWSGETGRVMDMLVDEFNQSNEWGINVTLREPGSTGLAVQDLRASESSTVNVAALPINELLYQDQNNSSVVDLNPYAASSKVGFSKDEREDFQSIFWNDNLVGGKLYGIPAQQSAAVLFYNATWAKELGFLSPPKTGEAFKLQTCAANALLRKDNDWQNDGLGGWIVSTDADTLFSWLNIFGAVDLSTPIEKMNTTKVKTGFTYLFNLQASACAWSGRTPEPYDYFARREALAYSGTTQDIIPQSAAFTRNGAADEWQVIPYPGGEDSILLTNGLAYGVFKSDEQKELASWLFVRWMSQPVNQARLLQTSGSLPLGTKVLEYMTSFEKNYPLWQTSLALLPQAKSLPAQANGAIIRMVVEDAGTFLFKPEFTAEGIPDLLYQIDSTIKELSNRKP
jgi:multiple sugar transport system substrate-binding protein